MLIFLIIPLLFVLFQNLSFEKNILLNILKSILSFGFIIFSITEFLSLINKLNIYGVIISWVSIFIVLVFLIFKTKSKIYNFNLLKIITTFSISEKIYLTSISLIFLLLFYQGLIYPPNNWDSLTYHMSRIMYWLGNENVNHFPTHILRHLYQPPFAEYIITHLNLLQGNDYFSNSVQLLFLFFCFLPLNELLKIFAVNRSSRLLSFLFCITIPSVVLQATTTKNDIVCAFFILTTILFLFKVYKKVNLTNFVFLGLSIGLGMLTKGTFYIFILPSLLVFLAFFIASNLKQRTFNKIFLGLISVFFIFIINVGHFSRNYKINQDILNIDDTEHKMYSNEEMNGKYFISNLLKNVGLHIGYPFNDVYEDFILEFHDNHKIDINNSKLNFNGTKYGKPLDFETHEDLVPNTFHFLTLIVLGFFLLIYSLLKKKYTHLILLLLIVFQISLFVFYLKWQPWHTRLHIPIFVFSSLLVGICLNLIKNKYLLNLLVSFFLINFFFYFTYNSLRPIITNLKYTKNININDVRFKKYFANQISLYPEYSAVLNKMHEYNIKKIGLELYDWEYPLLSSYYYDHLKIVSINVVNITNKIQQDINDIDVIVSNNKGNELNFNGKTYINITPENKHICLYK